MCRGAMPTALRGHGTPASPCGKPIDDAPVRYRPGRHSARSGFAAAPAYGLLRGTVPPRANRRLAMRNVYDTLKAAVNEFLAKDTFEMGAALAYYTVFSLAPLILIAIAIASAVFGQQAA